MLFRSSYADCTLRGAIIKIRLLVLLGQNSYTDSGKCYLNEVLQTTIPFHNIVPQVEEEMEITFCNMTKAERGYAKCQYIIVLLKLLAELGDVLQ